MYFILFSTDVRTNIEERCIAFSKLLMYNQKLKKD